ncbi:DgyrCDS11005 [Dimorphilus gyrociliatus]|uniref:Anion exchange protein n=1 Tax=Dimorphilus gyrociliatus TaxID=2664684 RepID=A0A7I8W349_9ANNE|nr:DgyrCDS11005 [Dimorphilus gyrociliatus]
MDDTKGGANSPDVPVKDHGSFSHAPIEDQDIAAHHTDRWQHQAMYTSLHFPRNRDKRRHKHHRHKGPSSSKKREETDKNQSNANKPPTPPAQKVQFIIGENYEDEDHRPHDIFCEMDELRGVEGEREWKETARWIKFEEDVEEGAEKWSKPHVATLSLHSLFELRKQITSGTILLDISGENLKDVIQLVLESMVNNDLDPSQKQAVFDVLMSRHKHQHETNSGIPIIRSLADIGKKHSEKKLDDKDSSCHLATGREGDLPHATSTSSHKANAHFMKKIPPGSEASNILVGEVEFLKSTIIAFVRLSKAVLLGDLTEVPLPTRFLFILLGPEGNQSDYHEIGRSIATLMSDEIFHDVAYKARCREDLLAGIDEFLDQVTVLPPGEWDPKIRIEPPKSIPSQQGRKGQLPNGATSQGDDEDESHTDPSLMRTGRLFGGLIADVRRKTPLFVSDFKDCLHIQCIASFLFMYFACLAPIITFGGLLGQATHSNIAVMESILAAAVCGITYHLCSGQPLTVIGSTGPVLIFETVAFTLCQQWGLHYLSFRFWIGLWSCLFLLIIVMFDLSALVRYITRFTEESFAALIAAIFVYEAFHKAINIHSEYPVNYDSINRLCECNLAENISRKNNSQKLISNFESGYLKNNSLATYDELCKTLNGTLVGPGCKSTDNIFFFSIILFVGTFVIAITLKNVRNTRFFPTKIRSILSDFSVMIAIVSFCCLDIYMSLDTPKLVVPPTFKPTRNDRNWFIHPFSGNPWWTSLAAIGPALLATILIFMDQQITGVIVNRKENKLVKGGGYHLDLFVIAIQIGLCSIMGLPWFVAATVLSINHVRSLSKESKCSAPGERPKYIGVREQRVTGIIVFLLIGLSVLMTPILLYVPMPVLYGVFLYMGVSSLKGVQLVQRIMIIFMPPKYQPDYMFLRKVPLWRVHFFTLIQIICFVLLWVIKKTRFLAITFPLMVMAMCFIRKLLDYVFTRHELIWLDDIMPESHKREKEDQKREQIEMSCAPEASSYAEKATFDTNPIEENTESWKPVSEDPADRATVVGTFRKRVSLKEKRPQTKPSGDDPEAQKLIDTPSIIVNAPDSGNDPVPV